jgi:hypothetical protein
MKQCCKTHHTLLVLEEHVGARPRRVESFNMIDCHHFLNIALVRLVKHLSSLIFTPCRLRVIWVWSPA